MCRKRYAITFNGGGSKSIISRNHSAIDKRMSGSLLEQVLSWSVEESLEAHLGKKRALSLRFPSNASFLTEIREEENHLDLSMTFPLSDESRHGLSSLEEADRHTALSITKSVALRAGADAIFIDDDLSQARVSKRVPLAGLCKEVLFDALMEVYRAHLTVRFLVQQYSRP